MNNLLKIKNNLSINDIEGFYDLLYSNDNKILDIQLPNELTNNYIGLTPSLIQFIATWIRSSKYGKLILNIEEPDNDKIRSLYDNEYIFPIISLVWNEKGIFNKSGKLNLREDLKNFQNELFLKMKKIRALKGEKLLLTNFDHLPKELGILNCFEKNGEFISNEDELFYSLRDTLNDEVLKYDNSIRKQFFDLDNELELNGIIYELMKNTFEWAKDDEYGEVLDPNIRGVLIKSIRKKREKILEEYNDSEAIINYFKNKLLKENDRGEIHFFELSVFDSGSGFIKKFKSNNSYRELDDISIIKKCLTKHFTSATGLNMKDKGKGLDRILNILNLKGFIRIKTDQYCVYRNLITNKLDEKGIMSENEIELYDWVTNRNDNFIKHQYASGAVITIIFPLSIN
jgi:hypothetical protein